MAVFVRFLVFCFCCLFFNRLFTCFFLGILLPNQSWLSDWNGCFSQTLHAGNSLWQLWRGWRSAIIITFFLDLFQMHFFSYPFISMTLEESGTLCSMSKIQGKFWWITEKVSGANVHWKQRALACIGACMCPQYMRPYAYVQHNWRNQEGWATFHPGWHAFAAT